MRRDRQDRGRPVLDRFDVRILDLLHRDASKSTADVASIVGLSQSPCWKRIHRLEELGVIEGRVAVLNRRLLGLDVSAVIRVRLSKAGRHEHLGAFEQAILKMPEVTNCWLVLGEVDFIITVSAYDLGHLETFLKENLWAMPGIEQIDTNVILSQAPIRPTLPRRP